MDGSSRFISVLEDTTLQYRSVQFTRDVYCGELNTLGRDDLGLKLFSLLQERVYSLP